ncbi:V-type ATP synthase subunit E [Salarchaeum japonicum]|uniref:V-type ATP synthase subunit E n=1 Tax=Salarchaeum japonicum TaxID=555573 RepID=UPI003C7784D6
MSLDTVVEEIREDARERADEIRQEGEDRADDIVSAAESEADDILEAAEAEVEREIEREREQAVSSAKLDAKHERMSARRDALESVREDVEDRIASLDGEDREELTRALLNDAIESFDEDAQLAVHYAPSDETLLSDILDDYTNVSIAGEYDCLGGVIVESETSRVRVKNTFDSVLDDVWEDDLKQISNRLFDEQ